MSDYSQMLKGIIDGTVLSIIKKKDVYGYELLQILESYGFEFVSEGSIYPILLRMQKEKLIEGTMKDSELGPKRKYYQLTQKGEQTLKEFIEKWEKLKFSVDNSIYKKGEIE